MRATLETLLAHARLLRPRPARSSGSRGNVGERVRSAGVRFEPERLAKLRELIAAPDDGLLPPIAVQLLAAPLHLKLLADPRFPLPVLGLVHVANTLEERRALSSDVALDLEAFVEEIVSTPRGEELTLVTEARARGELVFRASTIALARTKTRVSRTHSAPTPEAPRGEFVFRVCVNVAESTGRHYASVARDLNPIHQHAWLARPFGFPHAIVHGTWTLSRALEVAREVLPPFPRRIVCAFRRPVALPSRIAIEVLRNGDAVSLRVASSEDPTHQHMSGEIAPLA